MLKLYFPFEFGKTFPVSQVFGVNSAVYKRFGLKAHNGVDWACPQKTTICAIAGGIVVEVGNEGWSTGYGRYVKIQHEGYQSTYGHLKLYWVKKGDVLNPWQSIGSSDNTGFSTGAHLHLTLKETDAQGNVLNRNNGYIGAINPLPLLNEVPDTNKIPSEWSEESWKWAKEKGIISDKSEPRSNITKEEFTLMLQNYDKSIS
jgi:murein DD-endopeptidase MepM/ murein hydrolase activator NlpD